MLVPQGGWPSACGDRKLTVLTSYHRSGQAVGIAGVTLTGPAASKRQPWAGWLSSAAPPLSRRARGASQSSMCISHELAYSSFIGPQTTNGKTFSAGFHNAAEGHLQQLVAWRTTPSPYNIIL